MSNEERLAQLLEQWDDSRERGSPASPEELCSDCPELVEPLRRRIEDLQIVDDALQPGNELISTVPVSGKEDSFPVGTKRFRPSRFYAMGGFGDVYLADDTEFGTVVVLKYLRNWKRADGETLRRFFLEADVTANLQHPGIVPVYDKGKDDQGQPFYAMRFVDNKTLAKEIEELHRRPADWEPSPWSLEFRRLLRSLVTVCETVAYAHAREYIHRDLKPSNIMIGPFGETLVMDWGLAKHLAAAADGENDDDSVRIAYSSSPAASVDGIAKGSPAYMSPEQAAGEWSRVGPASDTYSLGATLYALLTGTPPYRGSTVEVLRQVREGRFARPSQFNSSVPRALEAICLKAMSYRPDDRYSNAKELALDLDRWLTDAPVTAWREPWPVRTRRWLSLHRAKAAAISAATLMAFVALIALVVVQQQSYKVLEDKNAELGKAYADLKDSNALVEKNFGYARQAIRGLADQALGDPLLRRPGMVRVQESLLKNALNYYRNFIASQRPDDPAMQEELVQAHIFVASISEDLGEYGQARAEYLQAYNLLRPIYETDETFRELYIATCIGLGTAECELNGPNAGLVYFDEALELINYIANAKPDDRELRFKKVYLILRVAPRFAAAGRTAQADELRRSVDSLLESFQQSSAQDLSDETETALVVILNDRAADNMNDGNYTTATDLLDRAEPILKLLVQENPQDAMFRRLHLALLMNRAELLCRTGDFETGLVRFAESRAGLQTLARENPEVVEFQITAAKAGVFEGSSHCKFGHLDTARERLNEAVDSLRLLLRHHPEHRRAQETLSIACQLLGLVERQRNRPEVALEYLAEARKLLTTLIETAPQNSEFRYELSTVETAEGLVYLDAGETTRADSFFRRSQTLLEELVRNYPGVVKFRFGLAASWQNLGTAGFMHGKFSDALHALEQAIAAFDALTREFPNDPQYREAHQKCRIWLATAVQSRDSELDHSKMEERAEARRILQKGIEALNQVPDELNTNDIREIHVDLQKRLDSLPNP